MNVVAFWLGLFLLAAMAGITSAADVDGAANRIAPGVPILLQPALVFDSAQGQTHPGWSVLVTSNRISEVGPSAQVTVPANAVVIALPEMTLLPGLMDIHSHIFLHPYNEVTWDKQVLNEPLAYRTVEAVLHVKSTLLAGFTLLRDLGTEGAGASDVSIKRAIEEGLIPGPRLIVVTKAIVATASYGPGPAVMPKMSCFPKGRRKLREFLKY